MSRDFDPNKAVLETVSSILNMARRFLVEQIRTQHTWDRFDIVEAWERAEDKVLGLWTAKLEGRVPSPAAIEPETRPQPGPPRCPSCRRAVAVKEDGRFVRHIDEETYRVCKGSGQAVPNS